MLKYIWNDKKKEGPEKHGYQTIIFSPVPAKAIKIRLLCIKIRLLLNSPMRIYEAK